MPTIKPIDIRKLLTDLWAANPALNWPGLSDRKIADALSTTGATICRLRTGITKKTDGNLTIAIANFHTRIFEKKNREHSA